MREKGDTLVLSKKRFGRRCAIPFREAAGSRSV